MYCIWIQTEMCCYKKIITFSASVLKKILTFVPWMVHNLDVTFHHNDALKAELQQAAKFICDLC
jgi:hypothetical protein